MATVSFSSSSSLLLILALSSLLFSCSAQSSGCKSQIFSNNRTFSNCSDLQYLNSTLYWTFDSKTSNLTLAFTATPANTGGWVAWGINPKDRKMAGTQALLAYPDAGGAVVPKTYNITARLALVEGKISYDVHDLSAEMSRDGKISIFATVTLLPNATNIIQVWQVGPVSGGMPSQHAMEMENMMSTGILDLEGGGSTGGAPIPPPTGAPSPGTGGAPIPPPTGAPSPGTGGAPIPPPTGAPSPGTGGGGGGNSGNKIGNKNGNVVLSLFFLFLCSSIWV